MLNHPWWKGVQEILAQAWDILSQSKYCSAGWQRTGRCDCPAVGTSLPNRGKSPQPAWGEGGISGRPALILQMTGSRCLRGWLVLQCSGWGVAAQCCS